MKHLHKIFENKNLSFSQRLANLTDKYDADVDKLKTEFKEEIQERLYYLTDAFAHKFWVSTEDDRYDLHYKFLLDSTRFSYDTAESDKQIKKDKISDFKSECESVIARLDEINISYVFIFDILPIVINDNIAPNPTLLISQDFIAVGFFKKIRMQYFLFLYIS